MPTKLLSKPTANTTSHKTPTFRYLISLLFASLLPGLPLAVSAQDSSGDWLTFGFEQQTRMQVLDGQFRAGLNGDDQALEWRNLLSAEADFAGFSVVAELADMRTYFSDSDTPLDTTITNPLDILQAHVAVPLTDVLGRENEGFVKVGRFTMDQGSRRWVARNRFRNTINAFSGVHARVAEGDTAYEFFYTRPTNRRFDEDPLDNEPRLDNEPGDKIYWGAFVETRLPGLDDNFEAFLYGLDENRDAPANQRFDILSTGVRLFRDPAPSRWHYELEALYQFGDSPALNPTSELRDHRARFLHLGLGYSFDLAWRPRLSFIYHYASGDKNPLDNETNSFDSLYGVPRPDYGPTGIYRAFVRNNIDTPGLLLNLQPVNNIDGYIKLQSYSLATEAQGWRTTRYRHPGNLGEDQVGTQLETRARWHLLDNRLTLEGGYTWLKAGDYMDLVNRGDSHYYYVQTIVRL